MEELLIEEGYTRLGLSSFITLYFKGHLWNLHGYGEKAFFNEEFYGCESINEVETFLKHLYKTDSDINIIAIDHITNNILVYGSPIGTLSLYINDENKISGSINKLINNNSELDYQYLGLIRKFGYNQNDLTPYINIKRLLPGFIYRGNINTLFNEITKIKLNTNISTEMMLPLYLQESIYNRLTSIDDETIGVLLSGGLDSSTIAALLIQYNDGLANPKKLRFFTTENAEDLKYAKEVAEYLKIDLELISGDDVELTDKELFDVNETPIDLGSVVPNIKLFKKISSLGIKTVFTGDGPDELFRGYRRNAEDFNYHKHDILNELVYYHFPRLEKAARYYGINLVTPYITHSIWNMALSFDVKIYKGNLKDLAHGLIPESVIERTKEPLKNKSIREDKIAYQHDFLKRFIYYAENKGESIQTTKKGSQK